MGQASEISVFIILCMLYIIRQLMGYRVSCLVVSQVGPPLSLYIVGVDVPEPFTPVPDSNSSTLWGLGGSGLWGYRMCGLTSHASGAKRTMSRKLALKLFTN